MKSKATLKIGSEKIKIGDTKDIHLKISETYTGVPIQIPIRVYRAKEPGPTVFITAAVHGDELTGVGIIRELFSNPLTLIKGTLICIPVVNIFGFENHSRYLPDRRDLNRCFPGTESGTLGSRLSYHLFEEVIKKCDFGIDLHSAASCRTNFPQIRANFNISKAQKLGFAFGCELVINNKGHENSLRERASAENCPTILYEAGETLKFEPGVVDLGIRGVKNILKHLNMIKGDPLLPLYQTEINKSKWIRSNNGGILRFSVHPGDLVKKDDVIAECENLFFQKAETINAPFDGIVLGMTTLPAVKPGEPICHIGIPSVSMEEIRRKIKKEPETLHRKVQTQLKTNIKLHKKK